MSEKTDKRPKLETMSSLEDHFHNHGEPNEPYFVISV